MDEDEIEYWDYVDSKELSSEPLLIDVVTEEDLLY